MRRGGPDQECGDGRCAECMEEPRCVLKAEPAGFMARWTEEWELRIERGLLGRGGLWLSLRYLWTSSWSGGEPTQTLSVSRAHWN